MSRSARRRAPPAAGILLGLLLARGGGGPFAGSERGSGGARPEEATARLEAVQREIVRLRGEMEAISSRERGVLGDVERLSAALRLRRSELEEVTLRLDQVAREVEATAREIGRLKNAQEERRAYLSFRIREMYKRGGAFGIGALLGGGGGAETREGLRYAAFLSWRDERLLEAYREQGLRLKTEAEELAREQSRLAAVRQEAERARRALETSHEERERVLGRLQGDRARRQEAIAELEEAARGLGEVIRRLDKVEGLELDVLKFRGLLDRPAAGEVSTGFGITVHSRFRTEVPHPGWDIEAPEGAAFRAVFDGRVAFAAWLHGYGLTMIVDHGRGVLSIYAHASVLLAAAGDGVARGQVLGKVGDTGSLRGPYLYFEMREGGKPVNPGVWLRPQ